MSIVNGFLDLMRPTLQFDLMSIQLAHLSRFAHQAIQAVAFFVYDREQFRGCWAPSRAGLESREVTEALIAVSGVRNS